MSDIVVIGAGPAGVAAAVTAARAGVKVTLVEEAERAGGAYYRQPPPELDHHHFPPTIAENLQKGRELIEGLNHPLIDLRFGTLVWNATSQRVLSLYSPDEGPYQIKAKKLIVATGATERVMPFPGWTIPGVMTVGGAQLMVKGQGVLPGKRLVLAGTGPLLPLAAVQLLEAGAEIAAVVELQTRRDFLALAPKFWGYWDKIGQGIESQRRLREAGVPIRYGQAVVQALGETEVEGALIAKMDGDGRPVPGSEKTLDVDTICINFGFVPAIEITRLTECEHYFDVDFGCYAAVTDDRMETSQPGIFAVGETRGVGGVEVALLEGQLAGMEAARELGGISTEGVDANKQVDLRREWERARGVSSALAKAFAIKPGLFELVTDQVPICRCEEVTAGEVREGICAGATQLNDLKSWTRVGMGNCQARICEPILTQFVAHATGLDPEAVGKFTTRPPVKPLPMRVVGEPIRRITELLWEDHATQYGYVRIRK